MELPRDWKLLTEREILGKLYERVVVLEETLEKFQSQITDAKRIINNLEYEIYKLEQEKYN